MKRRRGLQNLAEGASGISCLPDPDPALVKSAAPPQGSKSPSTVAPAKQADREATRSRFPLGKKNDST